MVMTLRQMRRLGGLARAAKLSPARRSEIARHASNVAKAKGKLTGRPKKIQTQNPAPNP
jgi:hypothetical protein